MTITSTMSEAEQQAFKGEIEQIAIPMEEKGIESKNQALETARKAELRDGQIADLQTEVNKLNMKTNLVAAIKVQAPQVYLPRFRGPANDSSSENKEVVR